MHIGVKIKEIYIQKGIKMNVFCLKLGTVRDNVYKIFRKEDINTGLLLRISEVLEHDFFKYYRIEKYTESTQIEYLNTENKLLKEQIEVQKKYIESLEKTIRKDNNAT